MKDFKKCKKEAISQKENLLDSSNQVNKRKRDANGKEKDIYVDKTYVIVDEGQEREYLTIFFHSVARFTSKYYTVHSGKKTAIDFLVDKALNTAILKKKGTLYSLMDFWYRVTEDEVVSSSKSQYVGEITPLRK